VDREADVTGRQEGESFNPRSPRLAYLAISVALWLLSGCSTGGRPGEAALANSSAAAAAGADASTGSGATARAARPESPRRSDPLWLRAKDEDLLERARLAEAVGAAGLLEGLEDGGDIAETALAALPYADDADLALRRLGELALAAGPAEVDAILDAILAIAGKPPRPREPLDPEGARACGAALITLAGKQALSRESRARAVSAARALAEKGYVDASRIPGDLDPP
jgi:hypothetical protein